MMSNLHHILTRRPMHVPHSHTHACAHTHSAQARVFTQQVVNHMASLNDRPIIMPLSNPTHLSECTAQEAWDWTKGMCMFMCILGGGGGVCSQATLLPPLPFLPCPLPIVLPPPPLPLLAPLLFLFSHPSTSSTRTVLYPTLVCVYTCLPTFMTRTRSHIHTYMPMYIRIYIHACTHTSRHGALRVWVTLRPCLSQWRHLCARARYSLTSNNIP
jgi:hypothetical protein